jgi:hypothetical protein
MGRKDGRGRMSEAGRRILPVPPVQPLPPGAYPSDSWLI